MERLKVNIEHNRYVFCNIVDKVPEIGEAYGNNSYGNPTVKAVERIEIDPEQPTASVSDYRIYRLLLEDEDGDTEKAYIAYYWLNDPDIIG